MIFQIGAPVRVPIWWDTYSPYPRYGFVVPLVLSNSVVCLNSVRGCYRLRLILGSSVFQLKLASTEIQLANNQFLSIAHYVLRALRA